MNVLLIIMIQVLLINVVGVLSRMKPWVYAFTFGGGIMLLCISRRKFN